MILFRLCFCLLFASFEPPAATPDVSAAEATVQTSTSTALLPATDPAAAAASGEAESDPSAATVAPTPKPQEWLFRYKFLSGQKLRYENDQTMTMEATIGESRRVDTSNYKQRRVFTVLSVEESGSARLAMQFEHVWMKKKIDDLEAIEFDSDMKLSDVPVAFRHVAHELKGSAAKYWLSNLGVSLYPKKDVAATATAEPKMPSPAPPVETDTSDKGIQLTAASSSTPASKDRSKEVDSGSFLMPLPEHAVRIGDSWKETVTVPVRLTQDISRQVEILRTFRLDSVENEIATISFRSSINSSVKGASVRTQLIQALPRGSIRFDINRGVMLRREMKYNESVVGAMGPESLLTNVGTNTEELIEDKPSP